MRVKRAAAASDGKEAQVDAAPAAPSSKGGLFSRFLSGRKAPSASSVAEPADERKARRKIGLASPVKRQVDSREAI